jgi:hypothetical protein
MYLLLLRQSSTSGLEAMVQSRRDALEIMEEVKKKRLRKLEGLVRGGCEA